LIKSITKIYEENLDNPTEQANHTFTSILEEYPDFSQKALENSEESDFDALLNYFKNNGLGIFFIIVISIFIGLAFWKIHHENMQARLNAFKQEMMEDRNQKRKPHDSEL
jgi:hypothetical protein